MKDSALFTWKSNVTETITARTYNAKVSSMRKALEKLSQAIAERFKKVSQD